MRRLSQIVKRARAVRPLVGAFLLGLLIVTQTSFGQPVNPGTPPLSVIGLELHREISPKPDGLFLAEPGTTVTMLLNLPDRAMFAIESKTAAIKSFTDDKGTNLLANRKGRADVPGALQSVGITYDGRRAKMVVRSSVTPAEGATKVKLKGAIAVTCGTNLKTIKQTDVSLAEGTKFKLGQLDMEIAAARTSTFGDAAKTLQIKCNGSMRPIKSLRFLNGNKEIKSQKMGGNIAGHNDFIRETRDFALWENPASVTLEVELYTQSEVVQIPVNLEIGVGLGAGAGPAK